MITVILCSRNGERFIKQQIDSILRQNIPDMKLHVFDDCSTDNTPEILSSYKEVYPDRFSCTLRKTPTGSAALNFLTAIHEAEDSDYYMLSDQDDLWQPYKTAKLLAAMVIHEDMYGKSHPILVHSDAVVTDETLKMAAPSFIKYAGLTPEITDFNRYLIQNQVTGGACMFNRALRNVLISVPVPAHATVHDHWMAITAAAFGHIFYLDEPLYLYRQHQANTIGARKAGFIRETLRRLGFGRESKAEIDEITRKEFAAVYAQAAEFQKLYGAKLDAKKKRALAAFVRIPKKHKPGRMLTITAYRFWFNKFYRIVGEYIFI